MEKPWKVVLAFLGVFIAGAVFGGFFSIGIGRRIWEIEAPAAKSVPTAVVTTTRPTPAAAVPSPQQPAKPVQQPELTPPQSVQSAQLMRQVTNKLSLTSTQKAQIAPIIQRAVQDFWRQEQNHSRENAYLLQRLKQDIGKELTEDQQKQLDDLWLKALEVTRKRQAEAQAQRQAAKAGEPTAGAPAVKSAPVPTDAKPAAPETPAKTPPVPAAKPAGDGK